MKGVTGDGSERVHCPWPPLAAHSAGFHDSLLLKYLIQLSGCSWQRALTSAVAEQIPSGPSAPANLWARSEGDISSPE